MLCIVLDILSGNSLTKIMTAFTVINICNTFGLKVRDIPIIIQKEASMM